MLRQYAKNLNEPFILVEEKELAINRGKTRKFCAYYTVRLIKDEDGSLWSWEQYKFVEGNPQPVHYRKGAQG
ncbi:MAG: hypothetical protein QXT77_09295 [Candidatus Methanomethylicaceae archaeon]